MAQPSRRAIVPQGISVIWVLVPCTLFRQSLNEHETPGCKSASHGCRGVAELVPTFCPSTTVNMSTGPRMVARVVEFLDDQHETVTLQAETRTPRRRQLSASFKRVRTPPGELPPARRLRLKAESSACSRATCRLDPEKHGEYLVNERARKKKGQAIFYGPWPQKPSEVRLQNLREAERLSRAAAERRMAMREAGTWEVGSIRHSGTNTRLRLGPPGWCDTGGWVWLVDGRVSDVSRTTFDDGSEAWTSSLWRSSRACGICACEECGITQHPCACEHPPDPCRADWGPVPRLWLDIAEPVLAGVRLVGRRYTLVIVYVRRSSEHLVCLCV